MAQTAQDDFAGITAAQLISAYSSSWMRGSGSPGTIEGAAGGGAIVATTAAGSGEDQVYYFDASFPADQWAEIEIVSQGAKFIGPAVRVSASGSCYGAVVNQDAIVYVNLFIDGVFDSLIGSYNFGSIANGSRLYLGVQGSTISLALDATVVDSWTDATLPSGKAGIVGNSPSGESGGTVGDDWTAGNFSTGVVAGLIGGRLVRGGILRGFLKRA